MAQRTRVIVWNEYRQERDDPDVRQVYPDGIHVAIAEPLRRQDDLEITTATLDEPECGLSDAALQRCDVLIWWGHRAHEQVPDELVERVQRRVLEGMGLIVLHSAHMSKIFRRLMGTSCTLKWREAHERQVLWVTCPAHPILAGFDDHFILPHCEMYCEYFDVPQPDETILISSFAGGEVFRSGCTWRRGAGKVFYFQPGHETYPIYHDANVQRILLNAVRWARPTGTMRIECPRKPAGWFERR